MIATTAGEVLATVRARVRAKWASTTLLEATGVVELIAATRRALVAMGRREMGVWPWCDNKAAAELLNSRQVLSPPYVFLTTVKATAEIEYGRKPFSVGWGPAQHDTQLTSVLAGVNKRADAEAQKAFAGEETAEWSVPSSWVDGPTIILWDDKHVVVNTKQAVKQKFIWHAVRGAQ